MSFDKVQFASRLFDARHELAKRERKDVGRSELARRVGTTPTTIGRWEDPTDKDKPDLAMLGKLARVLAVDPGWLAFGDETAHAPRASPELTDALEVAEALDPVDDRPGRDASDATDVDDRGAAGEAG